MPKVDGKIAVITGGTSGIGQLVASSKNVRIAVAFWGNGATEKLGLAKNGTRATIVCKIKSGGTYPDEILKLSKTNDVKQCDSLDGNVYIFDKCVIIYFSNVSFPELALQEGSSRWDEAFMITDDPNVFEDTANCFESLRQKIIGGDELIVDKWPPGLRL